MTWPRQLACPAEWPAWMAGHCQLQLFVSDLAIMSHLRRCGAHPGSGPCVAKQNMVSGFPNAAEPNTQPFSHILCQTPNILRQTPKILCQTPSILCPTPNILCQRPKFRSKNSEQSLNIAEHAPSSLEPSGSKTEPPFCAQRGQMWGLRRLSEGGTCGVRLVHD